MRKAERLCDYALATLVVVAAGYAIFRAIELRVEYFDGFVYLRNARALAGDDAMPYETIRPPLVPLLNVPAVMLATAFPIGSPAYLVLPHLTQAVCVIACAAAPFFVVRRTMGRRLALFTTLIFVSDRFFVRYAAHVITDLLAGALAFAAIGVWMYAAQSRRWRGCVATGVLLGAAACAKYTMMAAPAALVAAELLFMLGERRWRVSARRIGRLVVAGVSSAATFYFVHWLAYDLAGFEFTIEGFLEVYERNRSVSGAGAHESPMDFVEMLLVMVSPLTVILALIGVVGIFWHRFERDRPVWLWLFLFSGVLYAVIGHTEARYALPLTPALAYVSARGVVTLESFLRRTPPVARASAPAVLAMALIAIIPGVSQAHRDRDPIFTDDQVLRAVRWAEERRSESGRMLSDGAWTFTPEPVLDLPHDEYFDTFHVSGHVFEYYTGRPHVARRPPGPDPSRWLAREGDDGDVLFFGGHSVTMIQMRLEGYAPDRELRVWALRRTALGRAPDGSFQSADARTELRAQPDGWTSSRPLDGAFLTQEGSGALVGPIRAEAGQPFRGSPELADAEQIVLVEVASEAFRGPHYRP